MLPSVILLIALLSATSIQAFSPRSSSIRSSVLFAKAGPIPEGIRK